eukprot:3927922-Prymnesium_polylepis.1
MCGSFCQRRRKRHEPRQRMPRLQPPCSTQPKAFFGQLMGQRRWVEGKWVRSKDHAGWTYAPGSVRINNLKYRYGEELTAQFFPRGAPPRTPLGLCPRPLGALQKVEFGPSYTELVQSFGFRPPEPAVEFW